MTKQNQNILTSKPEWEVVANKCVQKAGNGTRHQCLIQNNLEQHRGLICERISADLYRHSTSSCVKFFIHRNRFLEGDISLTHIGPVSCVICVNAVTSHSLKVQQRAFFLQFRLNVIEPFSDRQCGIKRSTKSHSTHFTQLRAGQSQASCSIFSTLV